MECSEQQVSSMRRCQRIHFVGIGGVGMCGIAEVLLNEGYQVSGSDLSESPIIAHLSSLGATIHSRHAGAHIEGVDVVVQSTAIPDDNPEIAAAKACNIPVIPRAEMLAELMRFKYGIAVSGTHGKTTTTSLVSSLLAEGGLDPSYVIGGKLNSIGSTAKLGASPYFVAEADESDASFLYLKPMMAIVTNIDADHMGTYNEDFSCLEQTFVDFLHHLPFYGLAVLCLEDEVVKRLLPQIKRPVTTYGFSKEADIRASNWQQTGLVSSFTLERKNKPNLDIEFSLPGKHNVLNALAAIAVASEVGVSDEALQRGLKNFQGVGRRFQLYKDIKVRDKTVSLIDDYGHHPREIEATIDTIRYVWPKKRLVHIFQPHRYSRTQSLYDDFCQALSKADELILLDIYAAGEHQLQGISSNHLAETIKKQFGKKDVLVSALDKCHELLSTFVKDGDIILMQGAGSVGRLAKSFVDSNHSL